MSAVWKGSQPVNVRSGSPMLRRHEPGFAHFGWFHDRIVHVGLLCDAVSPGFDAHGNAWVTLVSWFKITFLV